ncbi:M57 family metalloprotease [Leuconostoc falkenbergense]|uniref:M57 family metalloprotease n=1 Tax=Leuconostoc falkenbergense TaxID=2766470 RepID=UPI0024AD0C79|nr:M57 family metalloprotease [Leuconostoc falkenbergense]MDI6666705.1 M57 family metalloprotease [Leuconostoc falkenbergense]
MKLIKILVLFIGGVYLLNNPALVNQGYKWGQSQLINLKQNIAERQPVNKINRIQNNYPMQESNSEGSDSDLIAKWPRKDINVYYALDSTLNKDYLNAWRLAVTNWNKVGVVELKSVDREEQADIILQVDDRSNTNQAGVTQNYYMKNLLNGNKTIIRSTAKINKYFLDNYSFDGKVNTAEHELGHALGLQHDDVHNSVMNSAGSLYGIQQIDINQLKQLYD